MVTFLIFGLSILFMNIKNGVMVVIVLICIQEIVWTMICSIQRGLLNDYIDDQDTDDDDIVLIFVQCNR